MNTCCLLLYYDITDLTVKNIEQREKLCDAAAKEERSVGSKDDNNGESESAATEKSVEVRTSVCVCDRSRVKVHVWLYCRLAFYHYRVAADSRVSTL